MIKNLIRIQTSTASFRGRFAGDQSGSTAIEYALIASGISIAILVAVTGIGTEVTNMFISVANSF